MVALALPLVVVAPKAVADGTRSARRERPRQRRVRGHLRRRHRSRANPATRATQATRGTEVRHLPVATSPTAPRFPARPPTATGGRHTSATPRRTTHRREALPGKDTPTARCGSARVADGRQRERRATSRSSGRRRVRSRDHRTPEQLAASALGMMPLAKAEVRTAPERRRTPTYIGVENWLWIPDGQWATLRSRSRRVRRP